MPPREPEVLVAPRAPLRPWVPLLIAAVLIALDQALKVWSVANLTFAQPPEPVVPGLLAFTLTYNTGAAWSLLSGAALPLAIGRMLVGLGLLVYALRGSTDNFSRVVMSVIAAGAIGNAIDGFRLGKVVDMFYSPALSAVTRALGQGEFPIFNIADMCVVGGVLLLLVASLLPKRGPAERKEPQEGS